MADRANNRHLECAALGSQNGNSLLFVARRLLADDDELAEHDGLVALEEAGAE